MAIALAPTIFKSPLLSRCKPPELSDCTGQIYDEREASPCGLTVGSGGAGVTHRRHSLGVSPGLVHIAFDAESIPDQMDVYIDGTLVATTGRPVGTSIGDAMPWPLDFRYYASGQTFCQLVITGPNGTQWVYKISCPYIMDQTNFYNTNLNPTQEAAIQVWLANGSITLGRDLSLDLIDYDMRGYYLGGGVVTGGHFPDTYKKPNHPSFSTGSIYSILPLEGGIWGTGTFTVGVANLLWRLKSEIIAYFAANEPGTTLIFP